MYGLPGQDLSDKFSVVVVLSQLIEQDIFSVEFQESSLNGYQQSICNFRNLFCLFTRSAREEDIEGRSLSFNNYPIVPQICRLYFRELFQVLRNHIQI
ncbi:hypothetical protein C498_06645 [Haloferax volcanii DS2]|uniref:Uncharacterized protein n=1 Tax=Haloferax volcanii (strain ATCC 29605 / DSM 3757 / JCM 8879 / NBRC 14742 / NCIMB 2012 / VKM B-1768 / DS2) TaxID=309800 RepID=L9VAA2_HALVD|nr:hypothetical protein C498_06645 [Haloferax volcanii DS2]